MSVPWVSLELAWKSLSLVPGPLHVLDCGLIARCSLMVGLLQFLCLVFQGELGQDGAGLGLELGESPLGQAAPTPLGPPSTCCAVRGWETGEGRRGRVPANLSRPLSSHLFLSLSTASPFPLQIAPVTLEFRTKTRKGGCLASSISPEASEQHSLGLCG